MVCCIKSQKIIWIISLAIVLVLSSCITGSKVNNDNGNSTNNNSSDNNNNTIRGYNTSVCSVSLVSPTSDTLQQTIDEASLCLTALQSTDYIDDEHPGLSGIATDLQHMMDLATQGSDITKTEDDYTAYNAGFNGYIDHLRSIPLVSNESPSFTYALSGNPIVCFDTAELSVSDILDGISSLSVSDLASSQAAASALIPLIFKIGHIKEILAALENRVSLDIDHSQKMIALATMPPAPNICSFTYTAARYGLLHIEQILDTTRQNLAGFASINANINEEGLIAAREKAFDEMYTGINDALALSSINGKLLFEGQNDYTALCFKNHSYDLRLAQLGLEDLSASSKEETLLSIQKLDSAITVIETAKIDMGISDADLDFTTAQDEYNRLLEYQQSHPDDSCASYNLDVAFMELSLSSGKVVAADPNLTEDNKIHEPLPNSLTTSVNSFNTCTNIMQIAQGALTQIVSLLQRMKTLSSNAETSNLSPNELVAYQTEILALIDVVANIKVQTTFDGKSLLNGGTDTLKYLLNKTESTCFSMAEFDLNNIVNSLYNISISTQQEAENSTAVINQAINNISVLNAKADSNVKELNRENSLIQDILGSVTTGLSIGSSGVCNAVDGVAYNGLNNILIALARASDMALLSSQVETSDAERAALQIELTGITSFIDIADQNSTINGKYLISGAAEVYQGLCFHGQVFNATNDNLATTGMDISTIGNATAAMSTIQGAMDSINAQLNILSGLMQ